MYLLIYWICWFVLVRNMWWILYISHATTTDNANLANKTYFCFGLFTNLVYLLRPVDTRSIILDVLITLTPYHPCNIASHWRRWMTVDWNKLYLNLMCFKTLQKLDICALQRQGGLFVRAVRTAVTWALYYYSMEQRSDHDLGFWWYLCQDL